MSIFSKIIKRFIYPQHLYRVIQLQRNRKKVQRVYDDAQLKLYSQLLPKDFLHYGYFQNPDIHPHDISINHLYQAQEDYGWQIVNLVTDVENPVLDIGCGMGGLIALLETKNIKTIATTRQNLIAYEKNLSGKRKVTRKNIIIKRKSVNYIFE